MNGRALKLSPEDIIIRLREVEPFAGRGAGRSLVSRLQSCREAEGQTKHLVCNAVDGDRRVPIAKFLLNSRPEMVLDGLFLAAYAMGATQCSVCVNTEYTDEIAALDRAFEQRRRHGFSWSEGNEARFDCSLSTQRVPTSLVAAEDTALIRSLENRQPLPYLRDDADVRGVHGAPTLVVSIETVAALGEIFGDHPSGESTTRGMTRIVAVHGDVAHPCILEVPLGTTIASVLEQAEGRPVGDLDLKAVQSGGASGPFLSGEDLHLPISYEDHDQGAPAVGSWGLQVFRGHRSALDMAMRATAYLHDQSCGVCVFCREGSRQLLEVLKDLAERDATDEQFELLQELAEAMLMSSICGIGRNASIPVLSALKLFPEDFRPDVEGGPHAEGGA